MLDAINNGFTSVALDLSTLMLLKEKDPWKRLEHVIYATARVYWAAAERARELGIKISVEIEVGDIGKDISTAEEALVLYAGTLEKLSELASIDNATGQKLPGRIADAHVKELLKTANIMYLAAQLGSSHGYDINHNDMLEPYKGGVITEDEYRQGKKGYVIKRAKEIIERFGEEVEGLEIYIAYHGFSGFPIKIVPRLIDTGAGKVNINTDSQAEIWKVLQAWFPQEYKELFIVSYEAAQKKKAKLFELIPELHDNPEIAYSRAVKKPNSRIDVRNRVIFGKYGCPGARKLFRGAEGHALLEKLYQTFLRTDVKKRIIRDMFNKIRLVVTDDAKNGLTALEALDSIGYKRFTDLYTALGLKDSADLIKVDRFSELRLQKWMLKDLRQKAEEIAAKSSSAGEKLMRRLTLAKDTFIGSLSDKHNIADLTPELLSKYKEDLTIIVALAARLSSDDEFKTGIETQANAQLKFVKLAELLGNIIKESVYGDIILDTAIIKDEKERVFIEDLFARDNIIKENLEAVLSKKSTEDDKITARIILLKDLPSREPALSSDRPVMFISNDEGRFKLFKGAKFLNVGESISALAVPYHLGVAAALLSLDKQGDKSSMLSQLDRLSFQLRGEKLSEVVRRQLENGSWKVFDFIITNLPGIEEADLEETQDRVQAAVAAMIAA